MNADAGIAAAHLPVISAVFCAMAALGGTYQACRPRGRYGRKTILLMKGGTTLLASLLALYGALGSGLPAHWWLAGGIVVCAAADVTLEIRFRAGMLNFALGHLCFILAFALLRPLQPFSLLIFAALALLIFITGSRLRTGINQPLWTFQAYSLIIAAMLSLALAQPPPASAGALLFVISDCIVFYRLSAKAGRFSDHLCMLFYYGAQFLLALSTLFR